MSTKAIEVLQTEDAVAKAISYREAATRMQQDVIKRVDRKTIQVVANILEPIVLDQATGIFVAEGAGDELDANTWDARQDLLNCSLL